jgi:hypothetical protein
MKISMLVTAISLAVFLQSVFARVSVADELFRFLDEQSMELEGAPAITLLWTDDERQMVDRYFAKLDAAAPQLVTLLNKGAALGPINVVRVAKSKRSIGYAKQRARGEETYLVLSDMFFQAYDADSPQIGIDGGNYTYWFFVHEMVHLGEFRTTLDVSKAIPSRDQSGAIFIAFNSRITAAKSTLQAQGVPFGKYVFEGDLTNAAPIHDQGLPTKYCLFSVQEALAETVTATILAPNFHPPADIQGAISAFFARR